MSVNTGVVQNKTIERMYNETDKRKDGQKDRKETSGKMEL